MPTDYLLFNHGVNTREARPEPTYADPLFKLIQRYYNIPGRTLKKVALYWGNVNESEEEQLLQAYQKSSIWPQLWFRDFREKQLMQFAGDGALYISRAVSLLDVTRTPTPQELQDAQGHILSTHDITPRLELFLDALYQELGTKLLWYNFVHPGDPIAYPLEKLLPQLVDGEEKYIAIQDILTHPTSLTDFLTEPFSQTLVALLHGGEAHNSYWQNELVAQKIAEAIKRAVSPPDVSDTAK
jgi:hypothetical protein